MRLLDLLLPPACAACGRGGAVLCRACLGRFRQPADAADRFVAPDDGVYLGDALMLGMAAFRYDGAARRSLTALKYGGAARVAGVLAEAALPSFQRLLTVTGPSVLVPVPLHLERQRQRGYNQAALIAQGLARGCGLSSAYLLVRERPTARQHRLGRAARMVNMRGAIRARTRVSGSVIVVDDIVTTTATMEVAAAALREAGAAAVFGYSIAREI